MNVNFCGLWNAIHNLTEDPLRLYWGFLLRLLWRPRPKLLFASARGATCGPPRWQARMDTSKHQKNPKIPLYTHSSWNLLFVPGLIQAEKNVVIFKHHFKISDDQHRDNISHYIPYLHWITGNYLKLGWFFKLTAQ